MSERRISIRNERLRVEETHRPPERNLWIAPDKLHANVRYCIVIASAIGKRPLNYAVAMLDELLQSLDAAERSLRDSVYFVVRCDLANGFFFLSLEQLTV